MKTPQRAFVVEIKSGRRRSTVRPTSIWGNTDLKSLLREAETDAPHLFEKTPVAATSTKVGYQPESVSPPVAGVILNTEPQMQSHSTDLERPVETPDALPVSFVSEAPEDLAVPKPPVLNKPTRRPTSATRDTRRKNVDIAINETQTSDGLEALETENLRLKRMLAEHLGAENSRLRAMLERFGRT